MLGAAAPLDLRPEGHGPNRSSAGGPVRGSNQVRVAWPPGTIPSLKLALEKQLANLRVIPCPVPKEK
jgi:hypothetical protein